MPPASSYPSRTEWEAACWKKTNEYDELLQLLITSYERHHIVMRAVTLERLASGKSYKEIGKELWLSPQTISSIKKAASEKAYRSYLERSKKGKKKRIYSVIKSPRRKSKGTPRRTKYGILYVP